MRDKEHNECSFPDFLISTFLIGLSIPDFLSEYIERLKEEGAERGSRREAIYLGRKIEKGGLETNRLFEEFRLVAREILILRV